MAIEVYLEATSEHGPYQGPYWWRLFTFQSGRAVTATESWVSYPSRQEALEAGRKYCQRFGLEVEVVA